MLHLSRRIISANLKIGGSKMQPLSGTQRPDLLTALMNMSLVLRLPQKMRLSRSSSNVTRLPSLFEMLQNPHALPRSTIPCACHAKRHLNIQKWCEHVVLIFHILKSKCASRHNSVHFFDLGTSKSGANVKCF